MIESLLEEITNFSNDEFEKKKKATETSTRKGSESSLLATLPVVRAIVNRKTSNSWHAEGSDLIQTIALRLWRWREKYDEKSDEMSSEEWEAFAARTAYNEVNRYYSNQKADLNAPIENAFGVSTINSAEGNTETEFCSLVGEVWKNICSLSLRQKRALLLHSRELIIYLLKGGIDDEELMKTLEFSMKDWLEIKLRIPLTDAQIADFIGIDNKEPGIKSLTKSIKKGRHETRKNLRRLMDK